MVVPCRLGGKDPRVPEVVTQQYVAGQRVVPEVRMLVLGERCFLGQNLQWDTQLADIVGGGRP